jgi:hypothetical protein
MKVRIKQVPYPYPDSYKWEVEVRQWFMWCRVEYFIGADAKEQALACAKVLKHPQTEEVK